MNILREIQSEAIKSESDVLALLRKCRVLAARIGNDDLKEWIVCELDGYKDKEKLPDYRKTTAVSKGHFGGPFGSGLTNAEIPPACIPKDFRNLVRDVCLMEGIGAYCDLLKTGADKGVFSIAWHTDLYPLVGSRIYERMNLMQAWQEVSRGNIVNVIETVKNRILNFVLELESEFPNAADDSGGKTVESEKVQQIFNTYISGNVGNIASGGSHVTQNAEITVEEGNIDSLVEYLTSKGFSQDDTAELREAIKKDGDPKEGSFGPNVSSWIGRMVSKAASGTWKIATDVAVPFITKALNAYFGIGG